MNFQKVRLLILKIGGINNTAGSGIDHFQCQHGHRCFIVGKPVVDPVVHRPVRIFAGDNFFVSIQDIALIYIQDCPILTRKRGLRILSHRTAAHGKLHLAVLGMAERPERAEDRIRHVRGNMRSQNHLRDFQRDSVQRCC